MKRDDESLGGRAGEDIGPRAVLRAFEVLTELARQREERSLAELCVDLKQPKTSLFRLLHTLERAGYVVQHDDGWTLGEESFRFSAHLEQARPPSDFPACARPVLERLTRETGETATLGILSNSGTEMVYADVIESPSPLRFTVRAGNRRPLYSVAAGKALLAFAAPDVQEEYIRNTEFFPFTAETTRREQMPEALRAARQNGIVIDRNGIVDCASAIASPAFDRDGQILCAISVAGPTDRIDANRGRIEDLVREAGERLSRTLGYRAAYPPS